MHFHNLVHFHNRRCKSPQLFFLQDMMRHIQSLLYRSLCHRLVESVTFAPLAHRKKVHISACHIARVADGVARFEVQSQSCILCT